MKKTLQILKDESGIALMMAIFTVTVLMVIATEVMYETNVELVVSSQAVNQIKAHYAARAGVEISLLRIQIYRKASALLGDSLGDSKGMLDMIWQMPFAWPPVVPPETSAVDKGEIKKAVKASKMQGQYFATIESEGGKIDVNDLDSPSKIISESTRQQILDILTSKVENDEEFAQRHRGEDFSKIVDNLTDWIDADKVMRGPGGGDEASLYPDRANENIPPNVPFKTMDELHMVAGMTDEIYDLITPRLTVYGTKGVNVNYAKKEVIMSLSTQITSERADKVIADRAKKERGPFKDEQDFVSYLNSIGVNGNPFRDKDVLKVPLLFDPEFNFRIRSTGQAGRVQKDITAIVYDVDRVTLRLHDFLQEQKKKPNPGVGPGATNPVAGTAPTPDPKKTKTSAKPTVPNERPNIVYWNET